MQHAVLVYLRLSDEQMGGGDEWETFEHLEDELMNLVERQGVGELDGNEIGAGSWCLYLYGPDADTLADVVLSVLKRWPVPAGSYLLKRYGDPGAEERRIEL